MADARELGLAALRNGDPVTAAKHLFEVVQQAPEDAQAMGALGVALCGSDRVQEGVQILRWAVKLAPDQAGLHCNLAHGLELLEERAEAAAAYRRTLELSPGHLQAIEGLSRLAAATPTPERKRPAPSPPPRAAPASPPPNAGAQAAELKRRTLLSEHGLDASGASMQRPAALAGVVAVLGVSAGLVYYFSVVAGPPGGTGSRRTALPATIPATRSAPQAPIGTSPAALVVDTDRGFSFRLPRGFPTPKPKAQPPLPDFGTRAKCTLYDSTSGDRYAFVICYVLSEVGFDSRGVEKLLDAAEKGVIRPGDAVKRQPDAGDPKNPATLSRTLIYDMRGAENPRFGVLRMLVDRPRLWVIGFESGSDTDRDSPEVPDYLQSLTISPIFDPVGTAMVAPQKPRR